ncbi:MAG: hypothetical protein ACFFCS_15815, partial [Candidatus Hodarchaeota archaeon]
PNAILPVIHFYNKTTINNFITRSLEENVIDLGIKGFLETLKELMKNLGKFNKLTNQKPRNRNFEEIRSKSIELLGNIKSNMNKMEEILSDEISRREDILEKGTMSSYRANLFGTISIERHGQEAAFHWIDLALKNGLSHFFDDYEKLYSPWLPPGMEIFL